MFLIININITINNKYKIVSLCVKFISIKLKFSLMKLVEIVFS